MTKQEHIDHCPARYADGKACAHFEPEPIKIGQRFDTVVERDCVATTGSDSLGEFNAYDCDGIECRFILKMITHRYEK